MTQSVIRNGMLVHLLASPFLGGPERQVLGLARALAPEYRTAFLTFYERGLSQPLVAECQRQGFEAITLQQNAPRFRRAASEVAEHLRHLEADVLLCSGYKPDLVGWLAARQVGIPVVAIAHGWTSATWKVRFNEFLDRVVMRWMDAVVCVSAAQAEKVRRAWIPQRKIHIVRNAIDLERFTEVDEGARDELRSFFDCAPARVVGAAGRLSPEKGFEQFIEAASLVLRSQPDVGFVVFGDGPLRADLQQHITRKGLDRQFILAGFRTDVARFLPHLDVAVLSSHTEGLPVVVLEAMAAGVPVVATMVGGTPEVIEEAKSGYLVPPGNPTALADRMVAVLQAGEAAKQMGEAGRQRVHQEFSFTGQAKQYRELISRLLSARMATEEKKATS